ncbi:hypothetical protein [Tenacibaculum geojense]|uniref:Uncharacterized protein n=1 Tax=Tenacibaculum geojense TaxID=915352 RepID=A0ABW3JTA4_9FLAO
MKKISIVIAFLSVINLNAQKKNIAEYVQSKGVTSLIFTVDSSEELKTIKWNDVKEIFANNNKQDEVKIGCRVLSKSTENSNKEFEIKGKVDDLDKLINMLKKATKLMVKLD